MKMFLSLLAHEKVEEKLPHTPRSWINTVWTGQTFLEAFSFSWCRLAGLMAGCFVIVVFSHSAINQACDTFLLLTNSEKSMSFLESYHKVSKLDVTFWRNEEVQ